MTSKKSSANTFLFTMVSTLKKFWYFIFFGIVGIGGSFYISLNGQFDQLEALIQEAQASGEAANLTLQNLFRYYMFDAEMMQFPLLISIGVIGLGGLLGVCLFRFISNKKTVNVYYSLGVSRVNLFLSKLTAGIIIMTVAVAVPLLIVGIVNVVLIGSSTQLWLAILYYFLSYWIVGCLGLGVTAMVFSCVGTLVEAITFSAVIMLLPTIVSYFTQALTSSLVYGAPYGQSYSFLHGKGWENTSVSMMGTLSRFNPITYTQTELYRLSSWQVDTETEKIAWPAPNYLPIVIWALVTVAVCAFGMYLFKRRKAERCGFLGTSKPLNFLVTAILGLAACVACLIYLPLDSIYLCLLVGLGIYVVIYFFVELLLLRSVKNVFKGMKKLPLHLVIPVIVTLIFSTGLFGYSTRMPDEAQIESAAVTPVSLSPMGQGLMTDMYDREYRPYSDYWDNGEVGEMDALGLYYWGMGSYGQTLLDKIQKPEMLQALLKLHEEFASAGKQTTKPTSAEFGTADTGVPIRVTFLYKMKDGSEFIRSFATSTVALNEKLAILENEILMDQLLQEITTTPEGAKTEDPNILDYTMDEKFNKIEKHNIRYFTSQVLELRSNLLDQASIAKDMDDAKWNALLKAIVTDLQAQTAEQRLFPTEPALGYLGFSTGMVYETDIAQGGYSQSAGSPKEEGAEVQPNYYLVYDEHEGGKRSLRLDPLYSPQVAVTKDMQNTVKLLQEYGYLDLMQNKTVYTSAKIFPAAKPTSQVTNLRYYWGSSPTLHFMGYWEKPLDAKENVSQYQVEYRYKNASFPKNSYALSDTKQVNDLANVAHTSYFNSRDGYYVEFTAHDGSKVITYVPADKMPQRIADAVAASVK